MQSETRIDHEGEAMVEGEWVVDGTVITGMNQAIQSAGSTVHIGSCFNCAYHEIGCYDALESHKRYSPVDNLRLK